MRERMEKKDWGDRERETDRQTDRQRRETEREIEKNEIGERE